jgi:hypothetical protein
MHTSVSLRLLQYPLQAVNEILMILIAIEHVKA